jgi:hypothetical protein
MFKKYKVYRHIECISLLYLLIELDIASLIEVLSLASYCIDVEAEYYSCPFFAIAAISSKKALKVYLVSIKV